MSDGRIYGIFDMTAQANLQQMIFGTQTVSANSFASTWAMQYGDANSNSGFINTQNSPGTCGNGADLPFSPTITMEQSQCFATYLPTSASGANSIGRAFGTSGILW